MKKHTLFLLSACLCVLHAIPQNLQWERTVDLNTQSGVQFLDTDPPGNILACGFHGPNISAGVFVSKYDSNGNLFWTDTTNACVTLRGFQVDENGNSYLFATIYGNAYFGPFFITSQNSDPDIVVSLIVKYDRYGQVLWVKKLQGPRFTDVKIMGDGHIYATGNFDDHYGAADFGNNKILSSTCIFLTKFDLNGICKWVKQLADPSVNDLLFSAGGTFSRGNNSKMSVAYDSSLVDFDLSGNIISERKIQWAPYAFDKHGDLYLQGRSLVKKDINDKILMEIEPGQNIITEVQIDAGDRLFLSEYRNSSEPWLDYNIGEFDPITGKLIWQHEFPETHVRVHSDGKGNTYAFGGKYAGHGIIVKFKTGITETTGLSDQAEEDPMALFPNPSNGIVSLSTGQTQIQKITVKDNSGRTVYTQTTDKNGEVTSLNLNEMQKGIYSVEYVSDGKPQVQKIIVNH